MEMKMNFCVDRRVRIIAILAILSFGFAVCGAAVEASHEKGVEKSESVFPRYPTEAAIHRSTRGVGEVDYHRFQITPKETVIAVCRRGGRNLSNDYWMLYFGNDEKGYAAFLVYQYSSLSKSQITYERRGVGDLGKGEAGEFVIFRRNSRAGSDEDRSVFAREAVLRVQLPTGATRKGGSFDDPLDSKVDLDLKMSDAPGSDRTRYLTQKGFKVEHCRDEAGDEVLSARRESPKDGLLTSWHLFRDGVRVLSFRMCVAKGVAARSLGDGRFSVAYLDQKPIVEVGIWESKLVAPPDLLWVRF
jgi:hypothetical protein